MLVIMILMLGTTFTLNAQCFNESFGNIGSYGGYQTEIWIGDDGYNMTATDAKTDLTINGKAITVRNGSLTVNGVSGGIGTITMTTQRAFSGGSGDLDVFINGASVGTIPYSGSAQTSTITGINISGPINLKIENNSGDRVIIDDLKWTCYNNSNTITTGSVSPASFTVDCDASTTDNGTVDFTTVGAFTTGNLFTAQLSDATGDFTSPTDIGTLVLSGTDLNGTINITISANTATGSGYRVRIVSD